MGQTMDRRVIFAAARNLRNLRIACEAVKAEKDDAGGETAPGIV
jgi:hypothetical protein